MGSFLLPCGNLTAYHPVALYITKAMVMRSPLQRNMASELYYARSSNPGTMTLTSNTDMTGIAVVVASESSSHYQYTSGRTPS